MKLHDCDVCGESHARGIWVAYRYTGGDVPVICNNCGFVYVKERRSSAEIAEDWKRIYAEGLYDPTWPGVKARLYYVAEWIEQNVGLKDKKLLDIGSGEGQFLGLARKRDVLRACGIEPSGGGPTVEEYQPDQKFDIVTILWTLENCGDCNAMISKARECLKPDGHLVVATGSRILVPFRKPMSQYFSTEPQDLHAFRWSYGSLDSILIKHGFSQMKPNDFEQNDVLLVSARLTNELGGSIRCDDPAAVENHFIDWYRSFP